MLENSNNLGSALCTAIGLDPKLVRSISVTINCAVDDIVMLDVVASVFADDRMLSFVQDESNCETLRTMGKTVEHNHD